MTDPIETETVEDALASDLGPDLGEASPGPAEKTAAVDKFRILDDGSLSYQRGESYAMLLADGVDGPEAWKAVGGVNQGSSGQTLRLLLANRVFKARLAVLVEQKADLEKLGPHGEAMWAAKQSFRAARVAGDVTATQRAAELIARIADKLEPTQNSNPSGSTADGVRPVGRPPSEALASKIDPRRIRESLLKMGAKAPVPLEPAA